MGGIGSGSYRHSGAKATTDDYQQIDVRLWNRKGLLIPGNLFSWQWSCDGREVASIGVQVEEGRVILDYQHRNHGEPWEHERYPVLLNWTACHLGGKRPWLLCPASGCGRQVAILYSGGIFACRHCYELAYESQREKGYHRAARRANWIRRRLGWKQGIFNPNGGKPAGMHWRTFEKLKAMHDSHAQQALGGMAERLGLNQRKVSEG
jgi:hypothetical protein